MRRRQRAWQQRAWQAFPGGVPALSFSGLIRYGMCAAPGCARILTADPWQCGATRPARGKRPKVEESVRVCSEACASNWIREHAAAQERAGRRQPFWRRILGRAV